MPVSSCNSSVISCTSSCKQKRSKKTQATQDNWSNSFICRFCYDISLTTSCHPENYHPFYRFLIHLKIRHKTPHHIFKGLLDLVLSQGHREFNSKKERCVFFGAFNIIRKLFPRSTPPRNSQLRLSLEKANGENSPEPAAPQPQQLQRQRHHLAEKSWKNRENVLRIENQDLQKVDSCETEALPSFWRNANDWFQESITRPVVWMLQPLLPNPVVVAPRYFRDCGPFSLVKRKLRPPFFDQ